MSFLRSVEFKVPSIFNHFFRHKIEILNHLFFAPKTCHAFIKGRNTVCKILLISPLTLNWKWIMSPSCTMYVLPSCLYLPAAFTSAIPWAPTKLCGSLARRDQMFLPLSCPICIVWQPYTILSCICNCCLPTKCTSRDPLQCLACVACGMHTTAPWFPRHAPWSQRNYTLPL